MIEILYCHSITPTTFRTLMKSNRSYYIIRIQYLGFRFSGWQKQPGQKTVEQMLLKTLKYILPNQKIKVLAAGRTDAKVSVLDGAFELFIDQPILNLNTFLELFNQNLPPDIKVTEIASTDEKFNIIQHTKQKEYVYLFSYGTKNHPFAAPFITNIFETLNIDLMKKAARLFEGEHDFSSYTARLQQHTIAVRTIDSCEIKNNNILSANFFPDTSYALHIKGSGFMRYQVRMIMGALIQLGRGELSYANIEQSLQPKCNIKLNYVAPGSGLLLNSLKFE